jgi:hypothetical protein
MKFGDLLISSSKDKFLFWTCSASDFRIAFSWSSKSGNSSIGRNNQYRLVAKSLIPNLLCLGTAVSSAVCAIELTAPQFSDLRVTPWSRC